MLYLGIDPGANGGFACINVVRGEIMFGNLPDTRDGIRELLEEKIPERMGQNYVDVCCVERISSFVRSNNPKIDLARAHMRASLEINREMIFSVCWFFSGAKELLEPMPRTWQAKLNLRKKKPKESDTSWKNYLKSTAEKLFPRLSLTLRTADAILLMHYARLVA